MIGSDLLRGPGRAPRVSASRRVERALRPPSARAGTARSSSASIASRPSDCTTSAGSLPAGRSTILNSTPRPARAWLTRAGRRCCAVTASWPAVSGSWQKSAVGASRASRSTWRLGQRRAHRPDDLLHPRLAQRHRVGVALHEHDPAGARGGGAGQVGPVQQLALVEHLVVGRVQVLRPVVRTQRARAEAEHAAALVAQREHDPAAEAVDHPAAVAPLRRQPARQQLLLACSPRAHRAPTTRSYAPGENPTRNSRSAASSSPRDSQILARGRRLRRSPTACARSRRRCAPAAPAAGRGARAARRSRGSSSSRSSWTP